MEELVAVTRTRLAGRQRRVVVGGPLVKAAVLVPLVDRGEPFLVFAKRTDRVGTHRGQISFPGGRVDPSDAGFLDAALRESEEEIGLPRTAVEPLGALDDTETVATVIIKPSRRSEGASGWHPTATNREVIEGTLAALRDSRICARAPRAGGVLPTRSVLDDKGDDLGATARILKRSRRPRRSVRDLVGDCAACVHARPVT